MTKNIELYLRNIIFGVADSLISTVGLLSGINISGTSRHTIVLTGIVYAFVEAFSMAVGSFLSEQSVEEFLVKGEVTGVKPLVAGSSMFLSFVLTSFIPVFPYMFFGLAAALWLSVGLSVAALFVIGLVSAKIVKVQVLKHAIKMALLGSAAIVIGVIVGRFFRVG